MRKTINHYSQRLFPSSFDRDVVSVLIVNFFWTVPWGLFQPFLSPYFFELSQGDYFLTGLLNGIPFFMAIFSIFFWGWIVDKVGSKKVMVVAFLIFILLFITLIFITDPLLFFLDYVVLNSLLACFSPAVWKYASLTNKDHIFGSMGATTSLGYFFGAILSGFLFESLGMNTLFFLSLAACFLGLVITLFSHDLRQSSPITGHESSNSSLQNKTTATNFLTLLFSSKILIVLFVIAIIQNFQGTFAGMFVTIYFLDELNTPPVLIGLVFGIATLAGAVASHYFGKIGEKRGYKELLVICYIGYLLVWISFIISVTDYLLPAVAYTLPIYVALFIAGPALVAKHIPEEKRGTFMGVFGASQNIGFAAGTILGGYFASQQGTIRFNFEISAIISVILIIFTLLFFKEERSSKD